MNEHSCNTHRGRGPLWMAQRDKRVYYFCLCFVANFKISRRIYFIQMHMQGFKAHLCYKLHYFTLCYLCHACLNIYYLKDLFQDLVLSLLKNYFQNLDIEFITLLVYQNFAKKPFKNQNTNKSGNLHVKSACLQFEYRSRKETVVKLYM